MKFLVLLLVLVPQFVHALDTEYYQFTNSKTYAITDDALLEDSFVPNNYPWMLTAAYDYVKVPLSVQSDRVRSDEIVKSLQALHLGGGYRITKSLFVGAKTYFAEVNAGRSGMYMGDSVLEGKWRFYQEGRTAIAFAPQVFVPTGTSEFTRNGKKVGEYAGFNLEHRFEFWQVSLMLGYANQPGSTFSLGNAFSSLNYKQSIYTAIGTIFPLSEQWALNIEGYRHNQLKGNQHPNEMYVGIRHQTTPSLQLFGGINFGGIVDDTSNDYRISAGLKFTPAPDEVKVVQAAPVQAAPVAPPKKISKREVGLMTEKRLYGELIASDSIYFGNGSIAIDKFSKDVVKKFYQAAAKLGGGYTIVLEGFASKKGNPISNMKLSQNRIGATRVQLATLGTNNKVINEVAYGDAEADMSVDEALNRKVMLRLYRKIK